MEWQLVILLIAEKLCGISTKHGARGQNIFILKQRCLILARSWFNRRQYVLMACSTSLNHLTVSAGLHLAYSDLLLFWFLLLIALCYCCWAANSFVLFGLARSPCFQLSCRWSEGLQGTGIRTCIAFAVDVADIRVVSPLVHCLSGLGVASGDRAVTGLGQVCLVLMLRHHQSWILCYNINKLI